MDCFEAREILHLVLDGEAPVGASDARAHVAACPECTEWQSSLNRAAAILSIDPPGEVPDIAGAVMASLPDRHPAARRRSLVPVFAAAGICVAAALLSRAGLLWWIWSALSAGRLGRLSWVLAALQSMIRGTSGAVSALGDLLTAFVSVSRAFRPLVGELLLLEVAAVVLFVALVAVSRRRVRIHMLSAL